jgi:hypothetical protein
MTAPFDTLKLARRLEAAGIEHKQAGDMAEAIAEATTSADLATKRDLRELGQQLTIRLGGMLVIATGILLAGLGATASIILNRLPPASQSAPAPRAAAFMLAGEAFNWDRYHDRQDTCRELDQAQRACANGWPAACDQAVLARLQRQCSAFGPLGVQAQDRVAALPALERLCKNSMLASSKDVAGLEILGTNLPDFCRCGVCASGPIISPHERYLAKSGNLLQSHSNANALTMHQSTPAATPRRRL